MNTLNEFHRQMESELARISAENAKLKALLNSENEDIQAFAIPCYHKRKIRYRPEVADLRDSIDVHYQDIDGKWLIFRYSRLPNHSELDLKQYETAEEALKVAHEYADKLRNK